MEWGWNDVSRISHYLDSCMECAEALRVLLGAEDARRLAQAWETRPLLANNWKPPNNLPLTLEDIDPILCKAATQNSQAELLTFANLKPQNGTNNPHSAFSHGASIVVNHADKVHHKLNLLCQQLAGVFRHTYCQLYFTPPGAQTAPPHSDDRDVLILHIHGKKRWCVWGRQGCPQRYPFSNEVVGKGSQHLSQDRMGCPELESDLSPGDVLYIPRGAPHVARASGCEAAPSLHVTIAIPTADLSWTGLVLRGVESTCFASLPFRRAIPLGPLPRAGGEAKSRMHCKLEVIVSSGSALLVRIRVGPNFVQDADDKWRAAFSEALDVVRSKFSANTLLKVLDQRMKETAEAQSASPMRVDRALSLLSASGHDAASRVGVPHWALEPLYPSTILRKIVPLELMVQPPSANHRRRAVAQARPIPGGRGSSMYTFVPPTVWEAIASFANLHIDAEIELRSLPAGHAFLRACAARVLLQLRVAEIAKTESTE